MLGTLLSEILESLLDQVTFTQATIASDHSSFSGVGTTQVAKSHRVFSHL